MRLRDLDEKVVVWMDCYGTRLLRYALAIVFIWFGILKPLGLSPAAGLVAQTVTFIPPKIFLPILGWWEVLIGVFFLFRPTIRLALILMFLQMPGTMLPLVLLPEVCYTHFPHGLTLEGQYIIKNLVLIGGALVVGGTLLRHSTADKRL